MKKNIILLSILWGCGAFVNAENSHKNMANGNENIINETEQVLNNIESVNATDFYASTTSKDSDFREKGYKWFIDAGAAVGVGTYGNGAVTMSTTHGYQFNPYFYAGAGLALEYHTGWEKVFVPIYINGRVNFMTSRVTPFFDMKLGYSAFDGSGFYMSPSAGVTISFSQKLALNVGLGYNMQMAEFQSLGGYSGRYYRVMSNEVIGGIIFKVGIEF